MNCYKIDACLIKKSNNKTIYKSIIMWSDADSNEFRQTHEINVESLFKKMYGKKYHITGGFIYSKIVMDSNDYIFIN